jgi:hypothetical protein
MNTEVYIQKTTYKLFQDRCRHLGLDEGRSLSCALYLRMSKVKNWDDIDRADLDECCATHNEAKQLVPLYLADKFFWQWRQRYSPATTMESAAINLSIRRWSRLTRVQAHHMDYMINYGLVLFT